MFLNRLSNEQKELFLDLCIHASKSNDDFSADEKFVIDQYCEEMHIPVRYEEQHEMATLAEKLIAVSSESDLKIILLETSALLLSDNKFDEFEQQFIEAFTKQIGMTREQLDSVLAMLRELTGIYDKIGEFIFG
ncbi:MAG: hypothetical protein IJ746_04315 [Ruminococcus sp.]|nr:hypothetical protein [Ruminococcus sp.]